MGERQRLGREFGWLWTANVVSSFGTTFALGAFSLIAVRVLHASAFEVAALPSAGMAAGAILAVPVGPWVEGRRKRPVMIAADLVRFLAMMSLPAAYAFGVLGFWQLLAVSVITAASKITFTAASGAYLKSLVPRELLLTANARFGSTTWTVTAVAPPLGGVAITVLGPVATVTADAVSYLLSALGVLAIGGADTSGERAPAAPAAASARLHDLLAGWRYLLDDRVQRGLFANGVLTGALIMATEPLFAILLLGQLRFTPWMYGLGWGVPCLGGLVASRLAAPLTARFGRRRMLLVAGWGRSCFPALLAFTFAGRGGLAFFIVAQTGLIVFMGLYMPVYQTYRMERLADDRVTRALAAWSVTSTATIALVTALWGVLATLTSARIAIAAAGILLLGTPALLPHAPSDRSDRSTPDPEMSGAAGTG